MQSIYMDQLHSVQRFFLNSVVLAVFLWRAIQKFVSHWIKCIGNKGDFVEKCTTVQTAVILNCVLMCSMYRS